jgi:hypothetical protein
MLRIIPLRLLRTTVTRSTVVRPIPATAARRRPKSSAAAAAPRDDAAPPTPKPRVAVDADLDDDDDDMEDMFVDTSMGKEWGGPTRGGRMPEPTRFGDWERKGRATDF